jgi:hypothetical protein
MAVCQIDILTFLHHHPSRRRRKPWTLLPGGLRMAVDRFCGHRSGSEWNPGVWFCCPDSNNIHSRLNENRHQWPPLVLWSADLGRPSRRLHGH